MEECIFCDRKKIKEDILGETDNLFLKVGFALVSPGQVMIVSKNHFPCFAAASDKILDEYDLLEKKLTDSISQHFSKPVSIEYGLWGHTIPHAHTHFIPSKTKDYDLTNALGKMILPSGVSYEPADRKRLKEIFDKEGCYLALSQNGVTYACHTKGLSEQEYFPFLQLRYFLALKENLEIPLDWNRITDAQKKIDDQRREETKSKISFKTF